MKCPNPTKCPYDDYLRTGTHFCAHGRCVHTKEDIAAGHIANRRRIAQEVSKLMAVKEPNKEQRRRLKALKAAYAESLVIDNGR